MRDGDVGRAVEAEDVEDVAGLRAAKEFLEANDIFEVVFEALERSSASGSLISPSSQARCSLRSTN